ncbi:MAG TPA: GNAT family N-acetyltransferase [Acidimicrobiales bacterium]|nr:GNAT family N-acetyltransferase [Acidimicrobiales bacterium]
MIRAYRDSDLERLYEICVRTGDAGQDAWDLVSDKQLYGHIWAAQYGLLEPEHAFVVTDADDVAGGYVLAALDTHAFEQRCDESYWPALQAQYPQGSGEGLDALLIGMIHSPTHMPRAITEEYPSHLHIDLLPPFQGGGWGKRMMETAMDSLRADGSVGLHLGVSAKNTRALGFYEHLGFHELHVSPMLHLLGIRL